MADALDWITMAEYKTAVGWRAGDVSLDNQLPTLITQASETLNEHLERQITPKDDGPTTHRFPVRGKLVSLSPYDLRAATGVVLDPEDAQPRTLTVDADYALVIGPVKRDEVATELRLSNWISLTSKHMLNFGFAQIDVSGSWGLAAVPQNLKRACIVTIQSWLRTTTGSKAYYSDDPRDLVPQPVAVGEIPYAAQNLARPWKRHIG